MGLLFSYILCLQIGIAFVGRNLILEVILTLLIKTFQLKLKSIGTKIVCDISTFLFRSDFSYDLKYMPLVNVKIVSSVQRKPFRNIIHSER